MTIFPEKMFTCLHLSLLYHLPVSRSITFSLWSWDLPPETLWLVLYNIFIVFPRGSRNGCVVFKLQEDEDIFFSLISFWRYRTARRFDHVTQFGWPQLYHSKTTVLSSLACYLCQRVETDNTFCGVCRQVQIHVAERLAATVKIERENRCSNEREERQSEEGRE